MKTLAKRAGAVAVLAAFVGAAALAGYLSPAAPEPAKTDYLSIAEIVRPVMPSSGLVFLLSDADGYGSAERMTARSLRAGGAIVVGVDVKETLRRAELEPSTDCAYIVGDVEAVSQKLQRDLGGTVYRDPIIVGAGAGATLALALAAQTPNATIGRTVAVDPEAALVLGRELCTGAPHKPTGTTPAGWVYGLQPGPLPDPVAVISTPAAPADGRSHVADLVGQGFAIERAEAAGPVDTALRAAGAAAITAERARGDRPLADLPIAVLAAKPTYDTMAIVLSGDGGWRDIDSELAGILADGGVPTIGLDSLRYFWAEKTPAEVATDLGRIVSTYGTLWKTKKIVLIGYSFGADVLPATFAALPPELASRVRLVSLMALSSSANFEIKVSGWVGMNGENPDHPTKPDLLKIPGGIVQCIYGEEDDDAVCPELPPGTAEVIKTEGGHHFDGDYAALAKHVLDRLK